MLHYLLPVLAIHVLPQYLGPSMHTSPKMFPNIHQILILLISIWEPSGVSMFYPPFYIFLVFLLICRLYIVFFQHLSTLSTHSSPFSFTYFRCFHPPVLFSPLFIHPLSSYFHPPISFHPFYPPIFFTFIVHELRIYISSLGRLTDNIAGHICALSHLFILFLVRWICFMVIRALFLASSGFGFRTALVLWFCGGYDPAWCGFPFFVYASLLLSQALLLRAQKSFSCQLSSCRVALWALFLLSNVIPNRPSVRFGSLELVFSVIVKVQKLYYFVKHLFFSSPGLCIIITMCLFHECSPFKRLLPSPITLQ